MDELQEFRLIRGPHGCFIFGEIRCGNETGRES